MFPAEELKKRTKQFAIRIVKLFRSLPRTEEARVIGRQMLRSGTSVAANYRAVCRARSKAEFIAKVGWWSKRLMKPFYDWNCWLKLTSFPKRG
jgi:hypothetical protein